MFHRYLRFRASSTIATRMRYKISSFDVTETREQKKKEIYIYIYIKIRVANLEHE